MHITSQKHGIITLSPDIPANFKRLLLPGTDPFFCEKDFGTILIQQFSSDRYSFRYSVFNILKRIALQFSDENSATRIRFVTKNDLNIEKPNGNNIFLKEGEFTISSGDKLETILFEQGKEYRLFDASYSSKMLKGLLEAFPSLGDFITNHGAPTTLLKNKSPLSAPKEMTKIVYDLLKRPQSIRLRRLYFENKVNDFFYEILAQAEPPKESKTQLSRKEQEAIVKARDIILKDITTHYTIRQLSQMVQLNESWLKSGFKKIFGVGVYEFLLQARMQEAMRLLTETDKPTKEIASLVGYPYVTNFIMAFRQYFEHAPGHFRKH